MTLRFYLLPTSAIRLHARSLRSCALLLGVLGAALAAPMAAANDATFERDVAPFLQQHCYKCHNADQAKAGFSLDQLKLDFLSGRTADHWVEVMDMLNLGDMPPVDEPPPDIEELERVVAWINTNLREAELQAANAGGQIPLRRLNRVEYANTVRDLFQLPEEQVQTLIEPLPADGAAEGFDRLGVALFFDKTQVERTLEVATAIADKVVIDMNQVEMKESAERPEIPRFEFLAVKEIDEPDPDTTIAGIKVNGDKKRIATGPPTYKKRENDIEMLAGLSRRTADREWGRLAKLNLTDFIEEDGFYRIKVKVKPSPGRPEPHQLRLAYQEKSPLGVVEEIPIDPDGTTETKLFLKKGSPDMRRQLEIEWNQTPKVVIIEPEFHEAERVEFKASRAIRDAKRDGKPESEIKQLEREHEATKEVLRQWEGPKYIYNPEIEVSSVPRIWFEGITVEGPVTEEWPPASHKVVFYEGDERRDLAYAREIIDRLLPVAYRRPVDQAEVEAVVDVVEAAMQEGVGFYPAMRLGVARILSSPGFLFLLEPNPDDGSSRALNGFELASRLSYFLWSSMPDAELFKLAYNGQLGRPEVLEQQVYRMLRDPKAEAFVRNFAGQWLDAREFGTVQPAKEYRDYDEELEAASIQEPYHFFATVLLENLPITNFLDSDFLVINERLAKHYDINGVEGDDFRKVSLEPEVNRGGVLGMAGLMTYLSDGTRTLPIRRATWVKTYLFDDPPGNPPPNAGEIQPNTEGENLTVRERLELHRNEPTCASCHKSLDPFGLALENYDAVGAWRTRANGEDFRGGNTPVLNISDTLPNGTAFNSLEEYKTALLAPGMKEKFARAFAKQLLTYALGRPVGYTDQATLEQFLQTLEKNDYRIQPLIASLVQSQAFRTK